MGQLAARLLPSADLLDSSFVIENRGCRSQDSDAAEGIQVEEILIGGHDRWVVGPI
jgi:hypothetical protein